MKRILVADDDRVTLRLHQLLLTKGGHRPVLFADGESALHDAQASPPDLALLDYQLPGKTGLELVEAFRSDPALQETPIIIVTGFREIELRQELLEAGANDVVIKPFSSKLLAERIGELVA